MPNDEVWLYLEHKNYLLGQWFWGFWNLVVHLESWMKEEIKWVILRFAWILNWLFGILALGTGLWWWTVNANHTSLSNTKMTVKPTIQGRGQHGAAQSLIWLNCEVLYITTPHNTVLFDHLVIKLVPYMNNTELAIWNFIAMSWCLC